ncbi:MAG: hypothetical protein AAF441_12450 [Pseudomonadota bacterium]
MQSEEQAEIIVFPVETGRVKRKGRKLSSAQVIIFPGVRIERREYSLGDRLPKKPRKISAASDKS